MSGIGQIPQNASGEDDVVEVSSEPISRSEAKKFGIPDLDSGQSGTTRVDTTIGVKSGDAGARLSGIVSDGAPVKLLRDARDAEKRLYNRKIKEHIPDVDRSNLAETLRRQRLQQPFSKINVFSWIVFIFFLLFIAAIALYRLVPDIKSFIEFRQEGRADAARDVK